LLTDVIKGADVRVVELGDRLGFALESGSTLGSIGKVVSENFDGDGPIEPGVLGFVDLPHPPSADRRKDLEGA